MLYLWQLTFVKVAEYLLKTEEEKKKIAFRFFKIR
jgi:hypothetical protein